MSNANTDAATHLALHALGASFSDSWLINQEQGLLMLRHRDEDRTFSLCIYEGDWTATARRGRGPENNRQAFGVIGAGADETPAGELPAKALQLAEWVQA